jgi:hypothetical protein
MRSFKDIRRLSLQPNLGCLTRYHVILRPLLPSPRWRLQQNSGSRTCARGADAKPIRPLPLAWRWPTALYPDRRSEVPGPVRNPHLRICVAPTSHRTTEHSRDSLLPPWNAINRNLSDPALLRYRSLSTKVRLRAAFLSKHPRFQSLFRDKRGQVFLWKQRVGGPNLREGWVYYVLQLEGLAKLWQLTGTSSGAALGLRVVGRSGTNVDRAETRFEIGAHVGFELAPRPAACSRQSAASHPRISRPLCIESDCSSLGFLVQVRVQMRRS